MSPRRSPFGIGREVPTEVAQTAIERLGKNQPLDSAEAMRDYVDAAGGAAVPGALFSAGAGVKRTPSPNCPLQRCDGSRRNGWPGPCRPTPGNPGAPSSGAAGATSFRSGRCRRRLIPSPKKVEALRPFLEDKGTCPRDPQPARTRAGIGQ